MRAEEEEMTATPTCRLISARLGEEHSSFHPILTAKRRALCYSHCTDQQTEF